MRSRTINYVWRAGGFSCALLMIAGSFLVVGSYPGHSGKYAQQAKKAPKDEVRIPALAGKLSFVRDGWIYLFDFATGQETKLVEGVSAKLSPDGESLVYLDSREKESVLDVMFKIAGRLRILNLGNGQVKEFEPLRDVEAFNAVWSHDGQRIAFSISGKDKRGVDLAIMDVSTGKWERVAERLGHEVTTDLDLVWFDSWGPDDKSFLFHSLRGLYEARTDGSRISKPAQEITIDKPFALGEITSASTFLLSRDRRYVLFDHVVDLGKKGPNLCISVFDLKSGKLRRITPVGIDALHPIWLPETNEILFNCIVDSWEPLRWDICTIKFDGTGLKVILRDARDPSYAPVKAFGN